MLTKEELKEFVEMCDYRDDSTYFTSHLIMTQPQTRKAFVKSYNFEEDSPKEQEDYREMSKMVEEATTAKEIVNLMRKNLHLVCAENLLSKALKLESDVAPLLLEKYPRTQIDQLIELGAQFFYRGKENYCEELLGIYDDVVDFYAKGHICLVLGLQGEQFVTEKIREEFDLLAQAGERDDEDYEQGALIALHDLYKRFYKKKRKS